MVAPLTEPDGPLLTRTRRNLADDRGPRRREMEDWWGVIFTVAVLACGAALVLYVLLEWAAGM